MSEKYDKGLELRKFVVGEDYVNQSIANANQFNQPLQELVTEYCWGDIWQREGMEKRDRSLINLAMISALNRPHELALHVKGALKNGLSPIEIREVLLQVAIYCGVPAAIDSFRVAMKVLEDEGIDLNNIEKE
ncbi:MAG: carboxymuconolactone decarboxylase family protein [Methylocystaceae bacterium]|nr:carboxymuconolactone decarboxylase family protein [Methylocystaceae bacterium]